MKKKLTSLLLVLVLLCGMASAFAQEPEADAEARLAWSNPFTDVQQNAWYYSGVEYVCTNGLFNGLGDKTFMPETPMTRAMLVTVLWRLDGSPAVPAGSFGDVPAGEWYSTAVAWASANGIVNGQSSNVFNPNGNLTREQLASVLFRYTEFKGADTSKRGSLKGFPDVSKVSAYAVVPFEWAYGNNIVGGTTSASGTLVIDPQGSATRAQVALVLKRFADASAIPADPSVNAPKESILTVAGKNYYIGMTQDALTKLAGTPDETLPSIYGYTWYIFGTGSYSDFLMAGINDGKVVTLCSSGPGFSYMGSVMGDRNCDFIYNGACRVYDMYDENDKDIFHCVQLTDKSYSSSRTFTDETLYADARVDFHLVNAFRKYHGLKTLIWSDKAHESGRLHSQDMADNNYFSHTALDGSTPGARMRAQGISWRSCAENIAAGYYGGIEAHNGWVNSEGHRNNILTGSCTYLGVGFAYNSQSTYRLYATENFYS